MKNEKDHQSVRNDNYELFIVMISFISFAVIFTYYLIPTIPEVNEILYAVDLLICAIFLFDFFRRLITAPNRLHYLITWGWLDLLGSLPQSPLLRLVRIGHTWYAIRTLRGKRLPEFIAEAKENQAEVTLLGLLTAVLITLTLGSIAIIIVESGSPEANIVSGYDALWWAFVTVSTVGYGDYVPVTNVGRVLAVLFMMVGISLFSVLTGFLANRFQARRQRQQDEKIARLEAQLARIIQLLEDEDRNSSTSVPRSDEG